MARRIKEMGDPEIEDRLREIDRRQKYRGLRALSYQDALNQRAKKPANKKEKGS